MAINIADLFVSIKVNDAEYKRGLSNAQGLANSFTSTINGFFERIGHRGLDALVTGAQRLIAGMGDAVQASSDLNEEVNKSGVVFGSAAQSVVDWSTTTTQSMGVSQVAALRASGQFGALFRQMGALPDVAAANSEEFVQLAADLSSIYNIPIDQSLAKLRSGLAGEIEPLRTVNIFLNEHIVAQKAVELGLASSTAAVSEAAKVEARRILILQQGAIAQGDQARTARELAGAQRKLASEWEDGAGKLGGVFRPAVTAITNMLVDLAPNMFQYATNIMEQFANGLASGIRAILPAIKTIQQVFTYWFKPGSPPKILPDLTVWGRGALRAYLDGFQATDVKNALGSLGKSIETLLSGFVDTGKIGKGDLISRVIGSRDAITKAVSEFKQFGQVSSKTMADIIRNAGPAGSSISGLVRAYFDLESASGEVTKAQEELNAVSQKYQDIINPISAELSANQAAQQAIQDKERIQDLRDQIADLGLVEQATSAAREELEQLQAVQNAGGTGNFLEDVKARQRILDLQQEIAKGQNAASDAQLYQLQIDEIAIRQKLAGAEDEKQSAEDIAQAKLDAAKAAEEAKQKELDNAQALIDLQTEQNRLIAEQIAYQKELEQARLDAIKKAEDEAEKARNDTSKIDDAKFSYEFSTADTAGQLDLLKQKLAGTEKGTVDYYQTLTQLVNLQKQYNEELANPKLDAAAQAAKDAADAQFDYQFSLADTNGQLELLKGKLAGTTQGSADYYKLLQQISQLDQQRIGEINAVTDAQFQYQLAIADTAGQIELLKGKLASTSEGTTEYYGVLGQIASLQKQASEEAARDAKTSADAQFQYQLSISETANKISLLKQRLGEVAVGSSEYYSILSQIASLEAQAADETKRNNEKITDAQLQYNLALADTPGKIALMQAELAKTVPGSAEYFQILTKIHDLQEQYNNELEKTGETDISEGITTGITTPLTEASKAGQNLADAIKEVIKLLGLGPEPVNVLDFSQEGDANASLAELRGGFKETSEGISEDVKTIADSISSIASVIKLISDLIGPFFDGISKGFTGVDADAKGVEGTLSGIAGFFTTHKEIITKIFSTAGEEIGLILKTALENISSVFTIFSSLFNKDWQGAWDAVVKIFTNTFDLVKGTFSLVLSFFPETVQAKAGELASAGGALIGNFWEGVKGKWKELKDWFFTALKSVTDFFPGSEPKDSSSPLTGLADRGRAFVNNFWDGIKDAWNALKSWWTGVLSTFVTTISTYFEGIKTAGSNLITNVWNGAKAIWTNVSTWWSGAGSVLAGFVAAIGTYLTSIYTAGSNLITNVWNGIKAIWTSIETWWSGAGGVLSTFVSTIATYATDIYNKASALLGELWNGLKDTWKSIGDWWNGSDGVLTGFLDAVSDIGDKLYDGGKNIINDFWDGLKDKWGDVSDWFGRSLQDLRDLLPFSEPKDPDSPLRGLKKSGAALVDMFQSGMDAASFNINPLANSLLLQPASAAASTSTVDSSVSIGTISVVIQGNADADDVRKGVTQAGDDLIKRLRSVGTKR